MSVCVTPKIEVKEMKLEAESHVVNWYVLVTEGTTVQYLHNDGSLHSQAENTQTSTGWYANPTQANTVVARFKEKRGLYVD